MRERNRDFVHAWIQCDVEHGLAPVDTTNNDTSGCLGNLEDALWHRPLVVTEVCDESPECIEDPEGNAQAGVVVRHDLRERVAVSAEHRSADWFALVDVRADAEL